MQAVDVQLHLLVESVYNMDNKMIKQYPLNRFPKSNCIQYSINIPVNKLFLNTIIPNFILASFLKLQSGINVHALPPTAAACAAHINGEVIATPAEDVYYSK